ncbi:MAG: response regulator [Anaerolineaceae bacterium]|nr:response regulator [Anaerolineaceae bacterium]
MTPKRIAIVEDDWNLGSVFAEAFTLEGHTVTFIQDGATAVQQLKDFQPDVVTLDLHMPKVSGIEILKAIRADDDLAPVKVIIVSADPTAGQSAANLADMLLVKPVSLDDLLGLMDRLAFSP